MFPSLPEYGERKMSTLAKLLKDLVDNIERTAESTEADAVHDLRVSVRRATEAVRIFADDIPNAKRLRREIKEVRTRAGAVRDRDVTDALLRRMRLPAGDPARIYLNAQRDLAAGQLREFLGRLLRKERPARWYRWAGVES